MWPLEPVKLTGKLLWTNTSITVLPVARVFFFPVRGKAQKTMYIFMSQTTQNFLKKIIYIEADIDIHKQILFSIPSDRKKDIENILQIIAGKKAEITQLRGEIEKTDPKGFKQIIIFEKAVNEFKALAGKKTFQSIVSKNRAEPCILPLADKSEIDCLIKACDENGDWTILTSEGEIRNFAKDDVTEKP